MTVNFNGWWLQAPIFRTITPAITSFNHAVDRIRVAEDPENNLWTDVAFSVGTSLFVNMSNFGVTIKPKAFDITRAVRHLPLPNSSSAHPDPTIVGYIEPTNTMKFNVQYAIGHSSSWSLTNYTTTVKTAAIDTKLNMFPTDFIYVEQPNTLSYAARFTWEQRTQPITLVVEPAVLNTVEREWPAIQIHALMPSWRRQKFQPFQAQLDVWDGGEVKIATQNINTTVNNPGTDTFAEWEAFYQSQYPQRFSATLTDSVNYTPPRNYGPARRYSRAVLVGGYNQVQVPPQYREEIWQSANYGGYQFTRYFGEIGGSQGSVTLPTTFFNPYLNQNRTYTDINTYINEYWIPYVRAQFDGHAFSAFLCLPAGTLRLTGESVAGCTFTQFGQVLYARYAGTNPVLVSTLTNGNQNWSLRDYIEWYQTYAAPLWVATGNLPYFTSPPASTSTLRYVLIANGTTRNEQAGDDPAWTRIPWQTWDFFYQEGRWYPQVAEYWWDFSTEYHDVKPTDTTTDRWIIQRYKYYKHVEPTDQGVYPDSVITLFAPRWRPLAFGGETSWPTRTVNYPGGERRAQNNENLTGKTTTQYPAQWVPWVPNSTSQLQPTGTEGVDWRRTQILPASSYTYINYSAMPGFLTNTDVETEQFGLSLGSLLPMNGNLLQGDTPGLIKNNSFNVNFPDTSLGIQAYRTIPAQVEFQYLEPERRIFQENVPATKVYEPRVSVGTITGGTPVQVWASGNQAVGYDFAGAIAALEIGSFPPGRNIVDPRNFSFNGTPVYSLTQAGLPPLSGAMWVRWLPFSEVGGGDVWRDPFPNEDLTGKQTTTTNSQFTLVRRWANPGETASTFVYTAAEWRSPALGQDITGRQTQNITRVSTTTVLGFAASQLLSRADGQHVGLDNPLNGDLARPLRAKLTSILSSSSIAALHFSPYIHIVLARIAADQVALYRVQTDKSGNITNLAGPSVITQYNIATIFEGAWTGFPTVYTFLVDVDTGDGQYRYALMRIDPTNLTQVGGLLFIFDDGPGNAPAEEDWATLSPYYGSFRIHYKSRVDGLLKRCDVDPALLVTG
jgi:hypothetical protein